MRRAIPVGPEASSVERPLNGARAMRSAPQRFVETWIDAIVGFLFCVVLPIPIYATGEPFAGELGGTEFTIIATAAGYTVVWYCGRRLDAFPRATLQGNIGYVAPIAVLTYALIAAILLLLRIDYSRVQFFGSGILTLLWMAGVAQLRSRYLIRNYAVMPRSSIADMPVLATCRWLDFDDVQNRGMRVDAIVADLSADLGEGRLAALADAAIAGVPVLDRRYIVETMTGRTPLGGLTPNEFGALLPSRQYLVVRRVIELGLTVLLLPVLLPVLLVVAAIVRLDSPGPVFFVQTRIGRRGQPFRMIKFRTMFHGAGGPSFTSDRRSARHPGRRFPAPMPARRAAAALQYPARRHELGRTAPGGGVAGAGLCARHRALRAARHRAAGRDGLGPDQPGLCARARRDALEAGIRSLLSQALLAMA